MKVELTRKELEVAIVGAAILENKVSNLILVAALGHGDPDIYREMGERAGALRAKLLEFGKDEE